MKAILSSRLKAVYLYGDTVPDYRIAASQKGGKLVSGGAKEISRVTSQEITPPITGKFRVMDGKTFMERFADCFDDATLVEPEEEAPAMMVN